MITRLTVLRISPNWVRVRVYCWLRPYRCWSNTPLNSGGTAELSERRFKPLERTESAYSPTSAVRMITA